MYRVVILICIVILFPEISFCDAMDEVSDEFGKAYEESIPPPGSSIDADYKIKQVALGTKYTIKSLNLIYRQNQDLAKKYEKIIDQNKEIIRLLTIIAKRKDKGKVDKIDTK